MNTETRCPLLRSSTRSPPCSRTTAPRKPNSPEVLKKGWFTLVPSEYRSRAPCPDTKCERYLRVRVKNRVKYKLLYFNYWNNLQLHTIQTQHLVFDNDPPPPPQTSTILSPNLCRPRFSPAITMFFLLLSTRTFSLFDSDFPFCFSCAGVYTTRTPPSWRACLTRFGVFNFGKELVHLLSGLVFGFFLKQN